MQEMKEKGWRNDGYAKVTGRAKFTGDLKFPGMLHAVPVYSDCVHAILCNILTDEAEASPGVVKVLTHRDVPGTNRFGQIIRDFRIFVDDRIRYHGDVVAVVVAESRTQAIAAAARVRVETSPLPVLLDPEAAMKPDAVLIHENHGSNIINTHHVRRGDMEKGFAAADLILEKTYTTPFIEHAYMEPEVAVCLSRPDGTIEVYGSMQHPFSTRRFVAACLGLPLAEVEIVGTPLGGGFGGKDDTAAIVCARTALAARLLNRPVKMEYSREWSIRESYKRHPYRVYYKMGLTRAGEITAVDCRIIADGGAYCSVTPWVTWRSTVQCCGPYVVENVHCDTYGVYTNNVVTGAMRGFGSPQMNFVIESLIEEAAEKLGLSAIELRRRNMVRQGSVTITGQKLDGHTVAMEQVLDTVVTAIDYENRLARCSWGLKKREAPGGSLNEPGSDGDGRSDRSPGDEPGSSLEQSSQGGDRDELYGIGLAMSYRGVSLGAEGVDFCAAIVNVQADGSVLLEAGVHENGQGAEAAMSLILARELGIDLEKIRYRRSSTSVIPDSGTTVASRGTIMGGGAVAVAARELKTKIAKTAAADRGCAPEAIRFAGNHLYGPDESAIPFTEVIRKMFQQQQFPYALGVFRAPQVSWNEENGQGNAYFTWVYGCQAVELTVNRKTGKVTLLNAIACHDVGKAINNTMLLGQIYGGMAMSTGYALHEDLKNVEGKISNTNLNRYKIPRAMDLPEMQALIVENPDPVSPTGAKSIGEPANEIMAPAIANAIYRATGVRYYQLPIKIAVRDRAGRTRVCLDAAEQNGPKTKQENEGSEAKVTESNAEGMPAMKTTVNGVIREIAEAGAEKRLVDWLRDDLDLTGVKSGCDIGACGTCTVLVDGRPIKSCMKRVRDVAGDGYPDDRGYGRKGRHAASAPAGLPRCRRRPVRLLHAGDDPDRACPAAAESPADAQPDPACAPRQSLPLHRLSADHRRGGDGYPYYIKSK